MKKYIYNKYKFCELPPMYFESYTIHICSFQETGPSYNNCYLRFIYLKFFANIKQYIFP